MAKPSPIRDAARASASSFGGPNWFIPSGETASGTSCDRHDDASGQEGRRRSHEEKRQTSESRRLRLEEPQPLGEAASTARDSPIVDPSRTRANTSANDRIRGQRSMRS